jgi:hypothetical protein
MYAAFGAGILLLAVLLTIMMSKPDSDDGIGTTKIAAATSQNKETPPPRKPKPKPKPPVDPPDPLDVSGPRVSPATPVEYEPEVVEPPGDGITSPGRDGPSLLEPSSPNTSVDVPVAQETSPEEDEPDSPSNVEDAPTIPPPPADAGDQLKKALSEAKSPDDFSKVAKQALQYVDQAILTGDGETAKSLLTWAVAAAREANDDELSKTATLRYLEVQGPLTEEVIEGAKKRAETWKPTLGSQERASDGMAESPGESVTAPAPPQRSLADLLEGDADAQ